MKSLNIITCLIILFLSGCASKVYFTENIRDKLEKQGFSLKNVQFYTDRDVTLWQGPDSGLVSLSSGKVIEGRGKHTGYIYLDRYTPGVCDTVYNDKMMGIAFEGGQGKTLLFGKWTAEGGKDTLYRIYALDWKDNYGRISYDSTIYYVLPEGSQAKLMIDKKRLNNIDTDSRRMKGVKLD